MIIAAKTIVTGDSKTVLKDQAVLLGKGKIQAIGSLAELQKAHPGEEVKDYGDATILPGLIDVHIHPVTIIFRPDKDEFDDYLTAYWALCSVQQMLFKGVTTIRECGAPHNLSKQLVAAKKKGFIRAPRIIFANSALCATGGHFYHSGNCIQVDGEDDLRKAVREQIRDGATWIKVMASHRSDVSEYTQEELNALVDEAHRHNRKVAVHTSRQPSLQYSINAGADSIEHGCDLTMEQILEMKEKNIAWVPTLFVHRIVIDSLEEKKAKFGLESFSEREMETYLIYGPANKRFEDYFKPFAETGVMVVTGTDMTGHGEPPAPVEQEIALMVRYGMDPVWSIGTGTLNCAKLLDLDDELGEIAEGKIADILVVAGDASKDITALSNVLDVYQDGCAVRREL